MNIVKLLPLLGGQRHFQVQFDCLAQTGNMLIKNCLSTSHKSINVKKIKSVLKSIDYHWQCSKFKSVLKSVNYHWQWMRFTLATTSPI